MSVSVQADGPPTPPPQSAHVPRMHRKYPTYADTVDGYKEIARLLLTGASQKAVAEHLGRSVQAISTARQSDAFTQVMDELHEKADIDAISDVKRMRLLIPATLDYYEKIINSPDENQEVSFLRLKKDVAESVLDRVGPPKNKNSNLSVTSTTVTSSTITDARALAIEAARAAGLLIDTTAEDVSDVE